MDRIEAARPSDKESILQERARALAQERVETPPGQQIDIVEFRLARERYAVEALYVREVYSLKEYTPIPCTPSHVLGVFNLRGEIISLIDIRKFFDLPEKGLGDLNCVIILASGDIECGVLADVIVGARSIRLEDVQPPPQTLAGLRQEYIKGISPDRTAILDVARILSDERIMVNDFV